VRVIFCQKRMLFSGLKITGARTSWLLSVTRLLDGIAGDALDLESGAEKAGNDRLLLALYWVWCWLGFACCLGFLGWKLLRRRYLKRV